MAKRSKFYLNKSLLLEEGGNPFVFKMLILLLGAILAAFIYWAMNFHLEEIAVCTGSIETLQKMQKIQHLYGGTIETINIREGQKVNEGDILIILKDDNAHNRIDILEKRIDTMYIRQERLRAFLENREPDFSILTVPEEFIREQNNILNTYIKSIEVNKKIYTQQIEQLNFEILELKEKMKQLQDHKKDAEEEFEIYKKLHGDKVLSKSYLLKRRLAYKELNEDLFTIPNQIRQIEEKIVETNLKIDKTSIDAQKVARLELEKITHELPLQIEKLEQYMLENEMLIIKSPCTGVVQRLNVNTKGGVVSAGAVIAEILPKVEELRGIIEISPKDIGHIKPGQDVVLKFTTYDFGRYGVLHGKVLSISPTSISRSKAKGFYKGEISLNSNYINSAKGEFPVFAGLSFTADIHTGSKSMIEYFLRPIFTSMHGAMHER